MNLLASILLACALYPADSQQSKANQDSLVLQDFSRRAADYVAIHKTVRAQVHGIKPTSSPEAIARYEHHLADGIREQRRGAVEGAIFTPEIAAEFRRLIRQTMQGSTAARVHESMEHAEPVHLPALRVNGDYPEGVPLQSTPPSFLLNLPPLPPELEYRVVGSDLVLRDIDANLIVDVIRHALP